MCGRSTAEMAPLFSEVGADVSIGVGDARGPTGGVGEQAPDVGPAGMSRTATSGPRLRCSHAITASAPAENQQLIRGVTWG
jgi:hypothetical protein